MEVRRAAGQLVEHRLGRADDGIDQACLLPFFNARANRGGLLGGIADDGNQLLAPGLKPRYLLHHLGGDGGVVFQQYPMADRRVF